MDNSLIPSEAQPSAVIPQPLYVGTAGWSYPDWEGIVYTSSGRGNQALAVLSRLVDVVEINVTFYRPITTAMTGSWLKTVASRPHFRFTAKAPSLLTHQGREFPDQKIAQAFVESLRPLSEAERLGALLFQFPWSFKRTPENRRYLARLLDLFSGLPRCVEMRHASWNHEDFFEGLRQRKIAFCNIDQPVLEHCLAPSSQVTAPFAYIRLHGRNGPKWFGKEIGRDERYNYLYSKEELGGWLERIRAMQKEVETLYVITNNHFQGKSVVNALEILQSLGMPPREVPETLHFLYKRP